MSMLVQWQIMQVFSPIRKRIRLNFTPAVKHRERDIFGGSVDREMAHKFK